MRDASFGSTTHLPYPMLVQCIMELKGVLMADEPKKKLMDVHTRFAEKLLIKANIVRVNGRWQWDDEALYGDSSTDDMDEDQASPAIRASPQAAGTPANTSAAAHRPPPPPPPLNSRAYTMQDMMTYLAWLDWNMQLGTMSSRISHIESALGIAPPTSDAPAAVDVYSCDDEDATADDDASDEHTSSASSDEDDA